MDDKDDPSPEVLSEGIEKIVSEEPQAFRQVMMAMGMGPMASPIQQKMTEEHISKMLELTSQHDERQHELQKDSLQKEFDQDKSNRSFIFAGFIVVVAVTIFVLVSFKNQPSVLVPILTGLGGIVTGFLGGFGIGKSQGK